MVLLTIENFGINVYGGWATSSRVSYPSYYDEQVIKKRIQIEVDQWVQQAEQRMKQSFAEQYGQKFKQKVNEGLQHAMTQIYQLYGISAPPSLAPPIDPFEKPHNEDDDDEYCRNLSYL